ncbi:MAG: YARHG domain-containing protein [Bacteroidales bacterium]|nr:YARHG domain-containing protein [Bacteroidales bacterium]
MKTTLLTLATALLMASAATAQNLSNTVWTSLNEQLYIESDDGQNIKGVDIDCFTDGGGLPSATEMRRISSKVFIVNYTELEYKQPTKNTLMSVDCPKTVNTQYLYQENLNGDFLHILVKQDNNEYSRIQEFYDVINGTYTDKDGKKYVFNNETLTIDGKRMTIKPVESNYSGYTNCFEIDGETYCFAISGTGINIYTAALDEECCDCDYYPDKLWVQLRADLNANQGRWLITNQKIVMERYLLRYTKSMLRLMRNEIYARHGYKFASADLTAYFSKTSWYHPGTDNSKIKLSPLEQLNVNIIKKIEDKMEDDHNIRDIEEGL